MADENNKCKHDMCGCAKAADSDYCSEFCKEAERADITEITCGCPHQGCS